MSATQKKAVRQWVTGGSLFALIALIATTPFNMGGCSAEQIQQGLTGGMTALGGLQLNENDEPAMGQAVAVTVSSRYPLTEDEQLTRYVNLVGMSMINASGQQRYGGVFGVVEAPSANAYSGPAGYVLITRGLLNQLQDESELAAVIAHEVAHVNARHGFDYVKRQKIVEGVTQAGQAGDKRTAQVFAAMGGLGKFVLEGSYSADQEEEADKRAVNYLIKAGYDAEALVRVVQRTEGNRGAGNIGSSHPGGADRIAKIRAQLNAKAYGGAGARMEDRFKANVRKM